MRLLSLATNTRIVCKGPLANKSRLTAVSTQQLQGCGHKTNMYIVGTLTGGVFAVFISE